MKRFILSHRLEDQVSQSLCCRRRGVVHMSCRDAFGAFGQWESASDIFLTKHLIRDLIRRVFSAGDGRADRDLVSFVINVFCNYPILKQVVGPKGMESENMRMLRIRCCYYPGYQIQKGREINQYIGRYNTIMIGIS